MKMLITLVLLNLVAYPALHAQMYAKIINKDTQVKGAFEDLGINDKYVFYSESPYASMIGNYEEFTVLRGDLSSGDFKRFELEAGNEIHDIIGSKVLDDKLVLYYSVSIGEKSGPYEIYASELDLELNRKDSKLLTESKSDKYEFYLSPNKEYSDFILEKEFWIYNNKHEVVNSMRMDYTKLYDFRLNNDGSVALSGFKQGKQTIERVSLNGKVAENRNLAFPYPTYTIRLWVNDEAGQIVASSFATKKKPRVGKTEKMLVYLLDINTLNALVSFEYTLDPMQADIFFDSCFWVDGKIYLTAQEIYKTTSTYSSSTYYNGSDIYLFEFDKEGLSGNMIIERRYSSPVREAVQTNIIAINGKSTLLYQYQDGTDVLLKATSFSSGIENPSTDQIDLGRVNAFVYHNKSYLQSGNKIIFKGVGSKGLKYYTELVEVRL